MTVTEGYRWLQNKNIKCNRINIDILRIYIMRLQKLQIKWVFYRTFENMIMFVLYFIENLKVKLNIRKYIIYSYFSVTKCNRRV